MSSSTRANTRTSTVNTKKIALAALFTAASLILSALNGRRMGRIIATTSIMVTAV